MSMMKRTVSAFLCLVWITAMVFSVHAGGTTHTYSFSVTYHQTEARSMLAMINSLRTGSNAWYWESDNKTKKVLTNLSPLQYDYELERVAMQRAAEIVARFDHERPNGKLPWDMFSCRAACENLAYWYLTAGDAQTALEEANELYSGQGHRRNMLNQSITGVGLACAEYGGMKFWVQEFRYPSVSGSAVAANDSPTTVSVEIMDSLIASNTVSASPSSVSLQVGESAALPAVTQALKMSVQTKMTLNCTGPVTWSSSSTSVAKISGDQIVAVGSGTATLTGRVGDGKTVSVPVTVSPAPVTLTSIAVRTPPTKTQYLVGESFDQSGLTLTATYSDGSTQTVTSGFSCTGFSSASAGTNTITVSYTDGGVTRTTTFTVTLTQGYTLTYDANGGTGAPAAQTVSGAFTLSESRPYRKGFLFLGWSANAAASAAQYLSGQTVQLPGNLTIYAVWAYNENPAPGDVDGDGHVNANDASDILTELSRPGYLTAEERARADADQNGVVNAEDANYILQMQANHSLFVINYVGSGGSGVPQGQTGSGSVKLSAVRPARIGYTFLGWSTSGSASSVQYQPGASFSLTRDTLLYAVWEKSAVTLTAIAVRTTPTKMQYYVGESFDQSGFTLTAIYSDGSTRVVSGGFTCTGFSSATPGTKTITVSYTDGVMTATTNFTVTVIEQPNERIPGDVDGDGTVTLRDAALISRHIVGGWNITINESLADVDGDGTVTLRDSALISRYIVGGWNVVLL